MNERTNLIDSYNTVISDLKLGKRGIWIKSFDGSWYTSRNQDDIKVRVLEIREEVERLHKIV